MNNQILVTDSLFIKPHHTRKLEAAGYEVVRLNKVAASEKELSEAIKGKVGYILGGIEQVTDDVIESADKLKAITFTGTAAFGFIPGHELATRKGIAIGAAPYMNAHAVAEFGMTMTLMMCRDSIALARGGVKTFETTRSLSELRVGIVGLGHIGTEYAGMVKGMGVKRLSYYSRTRKPELEASLGLTYKVKARLLKDCDVIFVALPHDAGRNFFDAKTIASIKNGSIVVSIGEPGQFDLDALYGRLKAGELRVAFDENLKQERFRKLPLDVYYTPNESTAFNTSEVIEIVSDSCVKTLLNLLRTGRDRYRAN